MKNLRFLYHFLLIKIYEPAAGKPNSRQHTLGWRHIKYFQPEIVFRIQGTTEIIFLTQIMDSKARIGITINCRLTFAVQLKSQCETLERCL